LPGAKNFADLRAFPLMAAIEAGENKTGGPHDPPVNPLAELVLRQAV
jgi:hypothetical protein